MFQKMRNAVDFFGLIFGAGFHQYQNRGCQTMRLGNENNPKAVAQNIFFKIFHIVSLLFKYPFNSSILILSCFIVSLSRTVTALSSSDSKSTVMQYGVPISSCRR